MEKRIISLYFGDSAPSNTDETYEIELIVEHFTNKTKIHDWFFTNQRFIFSILFPKKKNFYILQYCSYRLVKIAHLWKKSFVMENCLSYNPILLIIIIIIDVSMIDQKKN